MTKLSDLKPGDVLIPDAGFDCMDGGVGRIVMHAADGLYVECTEGRHYLCGQLDQLGRVVGMVKA